MFVYASITNTWLLPGLRTAWHDAIRHDVTTLWRSTFYVMASYVMALLRYGVTRVATSVGDRNYSVPSRPQTCGPPFTETLLCRGAWVQLGPNPRKLTWETGSLRWGTGLSWVSTGTGFGAPNLLSPLPLPRVWAVLLVTKVFGFYLLRVMKCHSSKEMKA